MQTDEARGQFEDVILQKLDNHEILLDDIRRKLQSVLEHESHFQTLVVRETAQPDTEQDDEGMVEWVRDLFHFWCCHCHK